MKKIFILLLLSASLTVFAQKKTLYQSSMVKPKIGQAIQFENAWKAHLVKFHKGDDKRMISQIMSGDYAGWYHFSDGPHEYADMDSDNPKKAAHDLDYEMNVASKVAEETGVHTYRFVDTLSYNPGQQATKFVYAIYNLKSGKTQDLMAELKRALVVSEAISSQGSGMVYIKQMSGISPQILVVSRLKDGFKQLETNYFPGMTDKFKEQYIKMHGQEQWNKRLVMLPEICNSIEVMMVKSRPDLSS
jgi:hypothetical protein